MWGAHDQGVSVWRRKIVPGLAAVAAFLMVAAGVAGIDEMANAKIPGLATGTLQTTTRAAGKPLVLKVAGRLRGAPDGACCSGPRHSAVTVAGPCSLVKCAGRLTGSGQAVRTPRKRRKQRCPSKTALPNQSAPPRRQ